MPTNPLMALGNLGMPQIPFVDIGKRHEEAKAREEAAALRDMQRHAAQLQMDEWQAGAGSRRLAQEMTDTEAREFVAGTDTRRLKQLNESQTQGITFFGPIAQQAEALMLAGNPSGVANLLQRQRELIAGTGNQQLIDNLDEWGQLVDDNPGQLMSELTMAQQLYAGLGDGDDPHYSAKTESLFGGGYIGVASDGTRIVIDPAGVQLFGDDARQLVEDSHKARVKHERELALGKHAGKQQAELVADTFRHMSMVDGSIANMQEAVGLLKDGAQTGVFNEYIPSFRASTLALENVRNRMGLDIVGATTFGALSESELKFALDTALPTRMKQGDLEAWLKKKIRLQRILRDQLKAAAFYFSDPENNIAGWIEEQEAMRRELEQLRRDAGVE